MKDLSHDRLQQECVTWFRNTYPQWKLLLFHVPNAIQKYPKETQAHFVQRLSYLKAIGVTKGVYDLIFYFQNEMHIFDIKVGSDKLSKDQDAFAIAIRMQGGYDFEINNLLELAT